MRVELGAEPSAVLVVADHRDELHAMPEDREADRDVERGSADERGLLATLADEVDQGVADDDDGLVKHGGGPLLSRGR